MRAAERGLADMRLQSDQSGAVEQRRPDAVGLQFLDLLMNRILAARAAERLDPAGLAQQRADAGLLRELAMLGARGADEAAPSPWPSRSCAPASRPGNSATARERSKAMRRSGYGRADRD